MDDPPHTASTSFTISRIGNKTKGLEAHAQAQKHNSCSSLHTAHAYVRGTCVNSNKQAQTQHQSNNYLGIGTGTSTCRHPHTHMHVQDIMAMKVGTRQHNPGATAVKETLTYPLRKSHI